MTIRILHIFGKMNRGGAETSIMNVYRCLDRKKVQFDFGVHDPYPGHFDREIYLLGGNIHHLPNPSKAGFYVYGKALRDSLQKEGPYGGVHSHVHHFSGYILALVKRCGIRLRLAHSHNVHDGRQNNWRRNTYRKVMQWLIYRSATHMLGCSRSACETLFGAERWHDSRVKIIPNAINAALFHTQPNNRLDIRKKLSLPLNVPLIGHIGRFDPVKNHWFLIDIFEAVLKTIPAAHLVLVGDGPLRKDIESLGWQKGLDGQIHLLGVRSDAPEIIHSLDLVLFPSLYEGQPLVLLEAQAAGTPCVVAKTVTRDSDLKIGLMQFVDLDAPVDRWVEFILKSLKTNRPDWAERKRALKASGHDAEDVTKSLYEIYTAGK